MTETNRIEFKREDFFGGIYSPRNKELMRVFRDVEMVEALGSGMMRISKAYSPKRIFSFTTNFIKATIKFHSYKGVKIAQAKEKIAQGQSRKNY